MSKGSCRKNKEKRIVFSQTAGTWTILNIQRSFPIWWCSHLSYTIKLPCRVRVTRVTVAFFSNTSGHCLQASSPNTTLNLLLVRLDTKGSSCQDWDIASVWKRLQKIKYAEQCGIDMHSWRCEGWKRPLWAQWKSSYCPGDRWLLEGQLSQPAQKKLLLSLGANSLQLPSALKPFQMGFKAVYSVEGKILLCSKLKK